MPGLQAHRRRATAAALMFAVALELGQAPRAQSPDAADVVARVHAYLDQHEPKLSELLADEVFEQRTMFTTEYGNVHISGRRRLDSDVAFLRLPGELAWLGQRMVRRIDQRALEGIGRLDQVFVDAGAGLLARAKAIADANARHNLGHPRSLNLPTLPLDLLGRRRAGMFAVTAEGRARVRGHETVRLRLLEHAPGHIIAYDERRFVRTEVQAWVGGDGAIHRARVTLFPPDGGGRHDLRVEFERHGALGLLVPARLTESWEGREHGDGTATYTNYRRFQTSARLVPPK